MNGGVIGAGFLSIIVGFIWAFIFGIKGRGSVGKGDFLIVGAPAFVFITLGVLITAWGAAMP